MKNLVDRPMFLLLAKEIEKLHLEGQPIKSVLKKSTELLICLKTNFPKYYTPDFCESVSTILWVGAFSYTQNTKVSFSK
jgi:hypothetical protein